MTHVSSMLALRDGLPVWTLAGARLASSPSPGKAGAEPAAAAVVRPSQHSCIHRRLGSRWRATPAQADRREAGLRCDLVVQLRRRVSYERPTTSVARL
jgi:hypothetical protein